MIIFVPMSGDLFHYGHVQLLKNIKIKYHNCKILIGLHTDESIKKYKRTPILTFEERYKIISSCKYVHDIISFDCEVKIDQNFLTSNNIDFLVHGEESNMEKYKQLHENIGDKFITFPYTKGISTSEIIKRIISRYKDNI